MTPQPTRRDRWLALALLIAVLGMAYLLLVHPWWTQPMQAIDQDITALQQREARVRAQLRQAPQIAQQLQQAQQVFASRPGFLPQSSVELASSALVQQLEEAVLAASPENRSCAISNRSPLPADHNERFVRVAVQVRLRCGTPELATLLYRLESGSPRVFVNNLNLLAQRFQLSQTESGSGLDVTFELAGYLRPAAGTAPASDEVAHAN